MRAGRESCWSRNGTRSLRCCGVPSRQAETGLETNDDIPRDFGDEGLPLTEQGNDEAVAEELQDRLDAIDGALARLDAGTYGRSVLSGKPIPDERLEADPAAELTVEEARAQEAQNR